MFAIWELDEPDRLIAEAGTLDIALDKVDTMCRFRHDQAVAAVGATATQYRFEIRNPAGVPLARLDYHPDTTRPYTSVIVDELRTGDHT